MQSFFTYNKFSNLLSLNLNWWLEPPGVEYNGDDLNSGNKIQGTVSKICYSKRSLMWFHHEFLLLQQDNAAATQQDEPSCQLKKCYAFTKKQKRKDASKKRHQKLNR